MVDWIKLLDFCIWELVTELKISSSGGGMKYLMSLPFLGSVLTSYKSSELATSI